LTSEKTTKPIQDSRGASEAHERRRDDREASSLTGVIVTAPKAGKSPEAAIRSAGDGRAIVFVSDPKNTEAQDVARNSGAVIAECAQTGVLTPGRLRNAGYRQLKKIARHIEYVQFLDAETALAPDWISTAEKFMGRRPEVSMIEGGAANQRALPPESDDASGGGERESLGGAAAFIRADAFEQAGGFRGDLPVVEVSDLSVRLRKRGGRIWRLPSVMTIVRPKKRSLSGWWGSKLQHGYENAFAASLHGGPPERLGVSETVGAVVFGFALPVALVLLAGALYAATPALYPLADPLTPALGVIALGVLLYIALIMASLARADADGGGLAGAAGRVFGAAPAFLGACRFWFGKKTHR
jgi:hypothetical protein